jgi:glucosamine-6-phosphate isomerase
MMNLKICADYTELSVAAAQRIASFIEGHPGALLCFAAGETPLGALKQLVRMQDEKQIDLSSMYYVGLDEWVGLGYGDVGSCKQVMHDNFYGPARIPAEQISVFDGLDPDMERQTTNAFTFIENHGGIAFTMLGVGMNGHLGFNEPGTSPDFTGGVVTLDETTRSVGKKYFNEPFHLEFGITIGIKTLLGAKEILLIANGEKKAGIIRKALAENPAVSVPASLIQRHRGLQVFLDTGAAAFLQKNE